jgi:hypothetical protein
MQIFVGLRKPKRITIIGQELAEELESIHFDPLYQLAEQQVSL